MNSYFATAEQQVNPSLRGKPIGIIKALGRGCVIAASVEAKKFGVKTGSTVWEARKLCPQIVFVPSDMDKYFSLTRGLTQIVSNYSPIMEVFSIDEMFLDVTDSQKCFGGGVLEIALGIKKEISELLGEWMRASVGISHTKLLAKLASEMDKPDGLVWLSQSDYLERTQDVAVEEVCGIGVSRTKWLHARGAYSLGQARKLPELPLEIEELVWLRVNETLITILDLEPAKSVSRTYTTYKRLDSIHEILRLVRNLTEEAAAKLREMGMVGRTLCLSLSGEQEFWSRTTIKAATDDPKTVFELIWKEYEKRPVVRIRKAGVWITNLEFNVQTSMFRRREEMLRATDQVNEKWGLFTLFPAVLLGGELIRPEETGFLGDKYYRFRRDTIRLRL